MELELKEPNLAMHAYTCFLAHVYLIQKKEKSWETERNLDSSILRRSLKSM